MSQHAYKLTDTKLLVNPYNFLFKEATVRTKRCLHLFLVPWAIIQTYQARLSVKNAMVHQPAGVQWQYSGQGGSLILVRGQGSLSPVSLGHTEMERDQTVSCVLQVSQYFRLGCLLFTFNTTFWVLSFVFAGHYCVANITIQCPAGTYGPKEGLQRERDCAICPAGTCDVLQIYLCIDLTCVYLLMSQLSNITRVTRGCKY